MAGLGRGGWLLGAASAACVFVAQAAEAQPRKFDIPAGPAAETIPQFGKQAGVQVLARGDVVAGKRTRSVVGVYEIDEALQRLLDGTGLTALPVRDGVITIAAAPASAVSTDLPQRPDEQQSAAGSEAIVVTGSHLRSGAPTSPVLTITRRDIEQTGATSVEDFMRTLPQNSENGVNKENFFVALPGAQPTDHGAGINLRGLGQRATLVLLDGRRLAPSSFGTFVDVSMIPLSAIERIDVLTDGASAIYGSDAVGGVVNFVLRKHFDGFETAAEGGTTTDGGGSQFMASQTAGTSWRSGHALLAYEFRLEDGIKAGQRRVTVNEPDDTYLLPHERKHSLIGSIEQELGPGLRIGLTGTLARRLTDRTIFLSNSVLPVKVNAKANAETLSAEVAYDLPHGWLLTLDGNYAASKTRQIQVQPGGTPVVNSTAARNNIQGGELHLDGPLFDLPAGTVRLAVGGEIRQEKYHEWFESSTFARTTSSARRTVSSAYGEILVPLFSPANRVPGLELLELSAAARYDRYTKTGSSFDPKIGLLWSPLGGLKLRGAYSTSFRAPLLSEVNGVYGGLLLPAVYFYADPSQAPPGSILLFLQGSNPDVKPETSRNWTLGLDWSPQSAPGFKLSANYYSIRYSNRIALPTSIVTVVGNPAYSSIIEFNPDPGAVADLFAGARTINDFTGPGFTNGHATPADVDVIMDDRTTNTAFTATSGVDLMLNYAFPIAANRFVATANVTHIFKFQDQLRPSSPIIDDLNHPYQPLRWRARAGLSWSNGGWNGGLFINYAGNYTDNRTTVVRPVRSYTTLDANLSYGFGRGAAEWIRNSKISLYAENLLNSRPPFLAPDPSNRGIEYDPVNASARGRFIAVRLTKAW